MKQTILVTGGTGFIGSHTTVELQHDLPIDSYAARGAVGSFLLVDNHTGSTLAAGLVA